MTPPPPDGPAPRFQRLRQLFEAAKERPPADQEAFVRRLAGPDVSLANEVLSLLRANTPDKTADLHAAGQAGIAQAADALGADDSPRDDAVQSTATADLLAKLATSPKLDTNRYALEGEVGKGGMGVVMRIHDTHLNRRLAMKVLLERQPPRDGDEQKLVHQLLGRFLEEAQVTSQLDHPGVVPVHELGLDQTGKVYFTMRLVKGRTAGEIFALAGKRQEDWTTTRALEVVLRVCDTMAYAHSKHVLHRDLKPSNVMVGRFGEVYVMDWGLAKVLGQADRHDLRIQPEVASSASRLDTARKRDAEGDSGSSVVSMDNQKLGTPSYMAPEQARSEVLDQRADVYSIGAMLYELLTGQAPYAVPGLRQPAYRILEKVVEGPPKRIEDLTKGIPAELVAIVDKAMARDREQRYANVRELAADLRAYLDHRVVRAYRTGALVEMQMWVRRNKALAASLAAAAVILVVGIASTTTLWFEAREQTRLAKVSETRAKEQETLANDRATENAKLAQEKAALATAEEAAKKAAEQNATQLAATVRNFDQLAGVVLYERAIENEKDLYPAWPDKVAAMERWLTEDAGKLLAMQPEIERTVRDLEARALPPTAEQIEADRKTHPRFAEFEGMTKHVASLRHAQAIRAGTAQLVVKELSPAQQALNMEELNKLAWERVAPKARKRKVQGEEALGLAAARAAAAKAKGTPAEFQILDTLAWALVANGQDAAAKEASGRALDLAPEAEAAKYEEYQQAITTAIANAASEVQAAEQHLAELTTAVSERRSFRFELAPQRFLHDTLAELLGKLASLAAKEKADVDQRLSWAKQIQGLSLAHPNAKHTWAAVRAAIASNPKYAGRSIELREQDITGLVPIGENPVTHLWEFYELRSAWDGKQDPRAIAIPSHEADGSIKVTGATGIVFVLLPGGKFLMGAQEENKDAPNYDPAAGGDQGPHEVTLAPFFLARHELTQAQWARLWTWDESLRQPSQYAAGSPNFVGGKITSANPVEQVDWTMCDTLLSRHGLVLPTEAQWEYGCRGGTTTAWNVALEQLRTVANLASVEAKTQTTWPCESWRDGHLVHAPVGSFAANAFGLYDVHGNVWEWCREGDGDYGGTERAGDGLRSGSRSARRCNRGGGFTDPAAGAGSAGRVYNDPSVRLNNLGLRPARLIRP